MRMMTLLGRAYLLRRYARMPRGKITPQKIRHATVRAIKAALTSLNRQLVRPEADFASWL